MIIMVTGKAGCGKDTFYEIASKQIKQSTIRLAFADMVKSVADMYGLLMVYTLHVIVGSLLLEK